MGPESGKADAKAWVAACEVAANLRALSVRFDDEGRIGRLTPEMTARVDQIVNLFLEKRWTPPRRFEKVQPLSYILFQAPRSDPSFAEDVESLRISLEQFLFGEKDSGAKFKTAVGAADDVKQIASAPDQKFVEEAKSPRFAVRPADADEDDIVLDDDGGPKRFDFEALQSSDASWDERIKMRAVYDATHRAVIAYWAAMLRPTPQHEPVAYNDFCQSNPSELAAFEIAAIETVAPRIISQLKAGATAYCIVPLSYATFRDRRRRDTYIQIARNLPEDVRRFIIPSICGGPEGPSSTVTVEGIGALRQCFTKFDWQTSSTQVDLTPLKDARIDNLTFVPPLKEPEHSIALARMADLAKRAVAHNLRPGATNLMTREDFAASLKAGMHLHAGAWISQDISAINPRIRINPSQLPLAA